MTTSPSGATSSAPPAELSCPPRFATPRNLDRPTLGPQVAKVARQLGTPLMPWQQHVVDVAMEIDPLTGELFYRDVVLVVPRQSGKTTLVLSLAIQRALGRAAKQNIVYAAQTRNDARKKWEDDHLAALDASPIGKRKPKPYRVRKTNGNEAIIWRHNGSMHSITANGESSGHGPTLDLGFVDEAFAQADARLEQAYKPAMITRPGPQMWVVSTAGKSEAKSPYLWSKVKAGRERCEAGVHPGLAYFEWSAPEGADRADPATWWMTMPALGHTITEAAVAADFASMDPAEFDRAYLNIWNPNSKDSVLPAAQWSLAAKPAVMAEAPVALAIDVSPDSASASVAMAGVSEDGRPLVEVVRDGHRPGTAWVVERVLEFRKAAPTKCVLVDASGPAALLLPALAEAGIDVTLVSTKDHGRACGLLLDMVLAGQIDHRGQVELNEAVAGASRRTVSDVWLWSRRSSSVDISPLVAVTLALWGHLQVALPAAEPDFIVI